jgi:hypothetical protein
MCQRLLRELHCQRALRWKGRAISRQVGPTHNAEFASREGFYVEVIVCFFIMCLKCCAVVSASPFQFLRSK